MEQIAKEYQNIQKQKERFLEKFGDSSEDFPLAEKIRNIHQAMVHLRYLLSMERQQLEKEKMATQSMMSMIPPPSRYYLSHPQHHRGPYFPLNVDWSNYTVTPNYEYQFSSDPSLYKTESKSNFGEIFQTSSKDRIQSDNYKKHLEEVEKMCDDELRKVNTRIKHLRKLRNDWNCHEVKGCNYMRRKRRSN